MTKEDYLIAAKILNFSHKDYLSKIYKKTAQEIAKQDWTIDLQKASLRSEILNVKKFIETNKIHLLHPEHSNFPATLNNIDSPPYYLTYKGDLNGLNQSMLSIVGARNARPDVLHWLENEIPKLFKYKPNLTIVSGGAIGIDQKCHDIAILNEKPTLVVLPSGIGSPYPNEWCKKSQNSILNYGGGFLSEYLPWTPIHKKNFILRNRLISALSPCCFVVQCHIKSGTHITATHAIKQNREILTLPDFPQNLSTSGNLKLIADGATMICCHMDLFLALERNLKLF